MRVIVTGGSGFVGRALVYELMRRNVDTLAVVRNRSDSNLPQTVVSDYVFTPPGDVLVHLAENRDISNAESQGRAYIEHTTKILKQLLCKGFNRIIYVSSAVVYGDNVPVPRRPVESLVPSGIYGRSKIACEELIAGAGGVIARMANLYGEGMATNNVISHILAQIPGQGAVKILDETPVRDFIWIEDAVRGLADMALGKASGVFNLGTGIGTSIGAVVRRCLEIAGQSKREIISLRPSGRSSHIILDISDTVSKFGWMPMVSLSEGLSKIIKINDFVNG